MILISSPRLQLSIYCTSSFTTSSKSVISFRPLTCHNPVMPGFALKRRFWCDSYCLNSSTVGGLVPTRLISPFKTLKNCGSSSILVLRINFPTFVIRGSSFILNIRPFISFWLSSSFLRSSASIYMERNLYILKRRPFLPTRSWQ